MSEIRVVLDRGGTLESIHRVHGIVRSASEGSETVFGQGSARAFWRSSMKPFQALPVVRDAVLSDLDLPESALALACASHHACDMHVDGVGQVMEAARLSEADLACGPHRPVDEAAARALDLDGRLPTRVHNNCSGKHAAMLALARANDWPLSGYHEMDHPVQRRIRDELRGWLDSDPDGLDWGVDGCGVPTPRLAIREMAEAYARFVTSDDPAPLAVVSAMTTHPMFVSGPSAFSANLMAVSGGRILGKEGAEGVFCVGCADEGWGAAFKVEDGAMRALGPAVVRGLSSLGLLREEEIAGLDAFSRVVIKNTRDEDVATLTAETDGG